MHKIWIAHTVVQRKGGEIALAKRKITALLKGLYMLYIHMYVHTNMHVHACLNGL